MIARRHPARPFVVMGMNALRHGGSQSYAMTLVQLLQDRGVSTVVVAKRGALSTSFRRVARVHHVHWREGDAGQRRSPLKEVLLRAGEVASSLIIARTVAAPELVIVSQPHPTAFLARFAARHWPGVPVVALVHGTTRVEWPPACPVGAVSAVMAANAGTAELLGERLGRPIPNLGNVFSSALYWRGYTATQDAPRGHLLFLGTLTPNKTPPLFDLILALREGERLVVCGGGPDIGRLREAASDSVGDVAFAGTVDDPRTLIDGASAVVSAGRGAIEALSRGKPVVVATAEGVHGVARVADLDELAFHNLTGRTPHSTPSSPSRMRDAVDDAVLLDPSELKTLAAHHAKIGDITPLLGLIDTVRT